VSYLYNPECFNFPRSLLPNTYKYIHIFVSDDCVTKLDSVDGKTIERECETEEQNNNANEKREFTHHITGQF